MRILAAFLFLGMGAMAQPISFGIRAGVPLTEAYSDVTLVQSNGLVETFSQSIGYAIGPMAELHLPLGFSVEGDALYRPIQLSYSGTVSSVGQSTTSWEFPIVGKYHFLHLPVVKPYVEGELLSGTSARVIFSTTGFILGVGVEIKISRIRIEPDIRYDRWGADAESALTHLPTELNQAEFLVGLTF